MANGAFIDPDPADRSALLDEAQELGRTPPWTLAMLFGRFVVLDHGVIPGAGHVVTIYAHLEAIDPQVVPGRSLEAGDPIGEIGNTGTETAATDGDRARSLHLHWEIHIDDIPLGFGLSFDSTVTVYRALTGV